MNYWLLYKRTPAVDRQGWSRWPFYGVWHVLYGRPFNSVEDAENYANIHHRHLNLETCVVPGESPWTKERLIRRYP